MQRSAGRLGCGGGNRTKDKNSEGEEPEAQDPADNVPVAMQIQEQHGHGLPANVVESADKKSAPRKTSGQRPPAKRIQDIMGTKTRPDPPSAKHASCSRRRVIGKEPRAGRQIRPRKSVPRRCRGGKASQKRGCCWRLRSRYQIRSVCWGHR